MLRRIAPIGEHIGIGHGARQPMTTAFRNGIRKVAAHLAPDTLGDGELQSRFLNDGDETAFGVLVRRHAAIATGPVI